MPNVRIVALAAALVAAASTSAVAQGKPVQKTVPATQQKADTAKAKAAAKTPAKAAPVQQGKPATASSKPAPNAAKPSPNAAKPAPATAKPTAAAAKTVAGKPGAKQQPGGVAPSTVPPSRVPVTTPPPSRVPPSRVPVSTPPANAGVAARGAAAPASAASRTAAATKPAAPARAVAAGRDTAKRVKGKPDADSAVATPILRETFTYDPSGRRDPFASLMQTSELRPAITDLRLTGILYDPTGRRPIAVMRDQQTQAQYRVTTGMMLGRMRVSQIKPHSVIFSIEEFGMNRQDSLVLGDSSKVRIP